MIGIDRGSNDGIRVGLPVLAAGGTLIGQIYDVRPNTSFIRLITDPDSAVRVLHQQSRSEVVATGDTLGHLEIRIPWESEVELGHIFVTSGLDGQLPQGLPVGRVSAAEGTVQDAFRYVVLDPIAPLEQLEQVLVQLTVPPPICRCLSRKQRTPTEVSSERHHRWIVCSLEDIFVLVVVSSDLDRFIILHLWRRTAGGAGRALLLGDGPTTDRDPGDDPAGRDWARTTRISRDARIRRSVSSNRPGCADLARQVS